MSQPMAPPKKRTSKPKVRTGCSTCKAARVKCGEEKPSCARCKRLNLECGYTKQEKGSKRSISIGRRPILPATYHQLAEPTIQIDPATVKLGGDKVHYYDQFRNQVMYQLGNQLGNQGAADFWCRTVLQESARDDCIMEAVVGIGALSGARESCLTSVPLYKGHMPGDASSDHYYDAVKYYTNSLSKFRDHITVPENGKPPRSVLIATILLSVFETLQGNMNSVDQLVAHGIASMRDLILQVGGPGSDNGMPALLDDEGVREAEFLLVRMAIFTALLSPMYPLGKESILNCSLPCTGGPSPPSLKESPEVFLKTWVRFLTLSSLWYLRVQSLIALGQPVHKDPILQQEQSILVAQVMAWEAALDHKLDNEYDHVARSVLRNVKAGVKAVLVVTYTVLDPTGQLWDTCVATALEIVHEIRSFIDDTPPSALNDEMLWDGVVTMLMLLARECRDKKVRSEAMDLCRRVVTPHSRWDTKGVVLGISAIVAVEEECRNAEGKIPLDWRYEWTDASWNDQYTEFYVTLKTRVATVGGQRDERSLTLRPRHFGFA